MYIIIIKHNSFHCVVFCPKQRPNNFVLIRKENHHFICKECIYKNRHFITLSLVRVDSMGVVPHIDLNMMLYKKTMIYEYPNNSPNITTNFLKYFLLNTSKPIASSVQEYISSINADLIDV